MVRPIGVLDKVDNVLTATIPTISN